MFSSAVRRPVHRLGQLARRLVCWLALLVLGLLGVLAAVAATHRLGPSRPSVTASGWLSETITGAALLLACVALLGLAVGGGAGLLGEARSGAAVRLSRTLAPAWWRRGVITAAGLSLTAVPAVAATEAPHVEDSGSGCATTCQVSLDGLPMPDLPESATVCRHLVVPGDSLWRIAAAHVPRNADAADVAQLVRRIHLANRVVIGDEPDLIFPGTLLTVPGGTR